MLECQIHHHEPSMALARAMPSRGYQIHVDYQVRSKQIKRLVVSCHEKKLAKHVKRVREKKIKRDKERTIHKLSPFITSTLAFYPCTTLSPITRSTEMKNTKEKEEEQLT